MNTIKKLKLVLAGLLLCASAPVTGTEVYAADVALAASNPIRETAAPDASSSAWTPEQIDTYAKAAMERLHIPGLAVGIVREGQIVYTQGYGSAGPGAGPMTPQTPLAIGSTSKSFTALAVMQLVEDGRVDLEAQVTDYLPEFRLADPTLSSKITVADLLHQTSGLSTYDGIAFLSQGEGTLIQHIARLKTVKQTGPAGSGYQYSNLNYNILGAIVQQVSGQSYEDYITERIFLPLGMKSSFSTPERAKTAAAENSHLRQASGHQLLFGITVPTRSMNHSGTIPSGYLVSTAEDMSKYLIMQMNGGTYENNHLLSAENLEIMHKPSADMGDGSFYGMGWVNTGDYVWHNGTTENTYSEMRIHDGYGIFVLANSSDPLVVSYSGILPGIDNILHGQVPSLESLPDFVKLYAIVDGISLVIALLFLWSVSSLFRWRKAFRPVPWKITVNVILLLACNVAFPLLILHFLAGLAPWSIAVTWAPGIGWGMVILPWLLFFTGTLKLLLMLRAMLGRKSTSSPQSHSRSAATQLKPLSD